MKETTENVILSGNATYHQEGKEFYGTCFLSQSFMCFNGPIFQYKKELMLPFWEIKKIEKKGKQK